MNKTTTTTMLFKLGMPVKWKSGNGVVNKTKKGKIIGVIAAGKTPVLKKFPTLRANGKARKITSFIVEANGKYYWPHASQLKKA